MHRNDAAYIFSAREIEQGLKGFGGAQFYIEIPRAGQEAQKQFAALPQRQVVCAAFARMTRSDNKWRAQDQQFVFKLINDVEKMIEPQFEQIWRLPHLSRET